MTKLKKSKFLFFTAIISLVLGVATVFLGYSLEATQPIQINNYKSTSSQVFSAPKYSDDSYSYDERKFLPYSLDLEGSFYFEPLKQRKDGSRLLLLDLETRWGWVPIFVDSFGFIHVGELSGNAFQIQGLASGQQTLRVQIEPRKGVIVFEGNKTVFSSSVGLDVLNASDAHSIKIFNGEKYSWTDVRGNLDYYPPSIQGKSIPRISILGAFLTSASVFLVLVLLTNKRFAPVTNSSSIRIVKSGAWSVAVLSSIVWSYKFLANTTMSFGKEQVKRSDWYDSVLVASGEPYTYTSSAYPPGSYSLFAVFSHLDQSLSFVLVSSLSLGVLAALTATLLRTSNNLRSYLPGLLITICSFPVFFVIDRGNLDLLLAALLGISYIAIMKNRFVIGSVLAGLLTGLKFFPGLYFMSVIKPIRSRRFLLSGCITFFVFLFVTFAYWAIAAVPLNRLLASMTGSGGLSTLPLWVKQTNGLGFGAMITEICVLWNLLPFQDINLNDLDHFLSGTYVTIAIYVLLFFGILFVLFSDFQPFKRALMVICFSLVFSPVTFGYRAIFMITVLILLNGDSERIRKPILIGILIGTILSPIGEIPVYGVLGTLSTLIKPILIIVLITVLAIRPNSSQEKIVDLN